MTAKDNIEPFKLNWDGSEFEYLEPGQEDESMTYVEIDEEDGRLRIIYGKHAKVSFIEKRMIERQVRTMARAGFPHPVTKRRVYPGLKVVIEEEVADVDSPSPVIGSSFSQTKTVAKHIEKTVKRPAPKPVSKPVAKPVPEVSLKAEPPREIIDALKEERIETVDVIGIEPSTDMGSLTAYELGEILESYLDKGKTVLISKGAKGYKFSIIDVSRESFLFNTRKV